ncbi:MAG TPA: LptA/OstA family protein [Candidatus Baltobacteraceae bacterium]|jgi:lipopolysaccharide export system protein LptA
MRRALAAVGLFALLLGATPAPGKTPAPLVIPLAPVQPVATFGVWHIQYIDMNFNYQTNDYEFPNAVYITRPGGDVRADSAVGNSTDRTLTLTGHVVMHDYRKKKSTLTTDRLAIDGEAKTYVATGHTHYVSGDTESTSRDGRLDDVAKVLVLDGDVRIARGPTILLADRVRYDTATGKGHAVAKAGTITFPSTHPSPAPGAKPSPTSSPTPEPSGSPAPSDDWVVHYTSADFNAKSGDFSIPDHVTITRASGDVNADRADGNGKKHLASLFGHVVVHDVNGAFGTHLGSSAGGGPATLTCDRLDIDDASKRYTATGTVHYVHADTVADADAGMLDDKAHLLKLDGNAHVVRTPKSIAADHITYDTLTNDVHAESDPSRGVVTMFPGGPGPAIVPAKKITIRNPFSKKPKTEASPTPQP